MVWLERVVRTIWNLRMERTERYLRMVGLVRVDRLVRMVWSKWTIWMVGMEWPWRYRQTYRSTHEHCIDISALPLR
jgi:hypothetical protein